MILSFSKVNAGDWTQLRRDTTGSKTVIKESDIELLTLPLTVIINNNQTEKIEIFTILGRLVSSETLPPGSHEFHVETHGIYIVKVGDFTCKVAL